MSIRNSAKHRSGIHLLVTGGTIDSFIDRAGDTKTSLKSFVKEYLHETILPRFTLVDEIICLKDSREISDKIRRQLLEAIKRSSYSQILITHGTYTIADTAAYLEQRVRFLQGRTIVLTGSFYPLKQMAESDAPFNLGYAVGILQFLPPGIYTAMHGTVFTGSALSLNQSTFSPARKPGRRLPPNNTAGP